MSDHLDRLEQQQQEWSNPMEVWNPKLGKNVYVGDVGASTYLLNNAQDYEGYTGAVSHAGRTPIHREAYVGSSQNATPSQEYRTSYERSQWGDSGDYNRRVGEVTRNARVVPGVKPYIGFAPGIGVIDLRTMNPFEWYDREDKTRNLNPFEEKLAKLSYERNIQTPRYWDLKNSDKRNPYQDLSGRGYNYHGDPGQEEAALREAFLAGKPVDLNRLTQLSSSRLRENELSPLQQAATKYYAPALMAIGGAALGGVGGVLGAGLGAGWGALSAGAMSRFEDPASIALGAVGGMAGGYAGGQIANAAGAGPVLTRAAAGAGSALGRTGATALGGGDVDIDNLVRDVALGAGSSVLGGYVHDAGSTTNQILAPSMEHSVPSVQYNPYAAAASGPAANVAGSVGRAFWPGGDTPPRRRPQQRPLNPYRR